jgi:hypothetical protein
MKSIISVVFSILALVVFAKACDGNGGGIVALLFILVAAVILSKVIRK